MGNIIRDSGLNDLPFAVIESDVVYMVRRFKPDKSTERTVDAISLANFISDATILDTA